MVGRHDFKDSMVLGGKFDHVVHQIPTSGYVMRHHVWIESKTFETSYHLGRTMMDNS